jgi:hypothetical protein
MKNILLVLIVSSFLVLTLQFNFFNRIELTKKNGAMCLDGSPMAIYTYLPDDSQPVPNKLLIVF